MKQDYTGQGCHPDSDNIRQILIRQCTFEFNMQQLNNPLHGITLETMILQLVDKYGWEELGKKINIDCFNSNPSVKSSLKFLRKTPWARSKVENLYLRTIAS